MDITPFIYINTIFKTGMSYVGKHIGNNPHYVGSGVKWKQDYKKYVVDKQLDFSQKILELVYDINVLDDREKYWITYYDAYNSPVFYNMTPNSAGVLTHSEESRVRISINNRWSRPKDKEWRENISKSSKGTPKTYSEGVQEEKNRKISESLIKSQKTAKHVMQYDMNGNFIKEWKSAKEANEVLNIKDTSGISANCRGKQKSCYGYVWKFKNN